MFPLLLSAFFCLSVTLASTLSTPQSISPQYSNTTGNLRLPEPTCTIKFGHGEDLPINSCRDALSDMDRSVNWKQYIPRQRSPEPNQVPMPIRYLSSDGRCAIDIALREGSSGDATSGDNLHYAANKIIDECVIGRGRGGAFPIAFSRNSGMRVIVRSYQPTIDCESGVHQIPPRYKDCQEVLQRFPANERQRLFATEVHPNPPGRM